MRIAVLPERYGRVLSPCASIRIASYFDRLRAAGGGLEVRYLLPAEVESWRPDVVLWHRVALPDVAAVDALAEVIRRIGARSAFDLDDNLLDIAEHGEAKAYAPLVAAVARSIEIADDVWCSTPRLVERVARERDAPVRLLPNALDPGIWGVPASPAKASNGRRGRLLYMGTRTHDADYRLLDDAIQLMSPAHRARVQLTVIGVCAERVEARPWLRIEAAPSHVGASYPAFVAWLRQLHGFDFGVAPLLSNAFNDCKSAIKVLDYAALGLPALASDMPAYADALTSNYCTLVSNDAASWARAIERGLDDPATLDAQAQAARALVAPDAFERGVRARRDLLERLVP